VDRPQFVLDFSVSSASGLSKSACTPAFDLSPVRILHAPMLSTAAVWLWFSGKLSAAGPQIRILSMEIS